METLFGYLHLTGQSARIEQLFCQAYGMTEQHREPMGEDTNG